MRVRKSRSMKTLVGRWDNPRVTIERPHNHPEKHRDHQWWVTHGVLRPAQTFAQELSRKSECPSLLLSQALAELASGRVVAAPGRDAEAVTDLDLRADSRQRWRLSSQRRTYRRSERCGSAGRARFISKFRHRSCTRPATRRGSRYCRRQATAPRVRSLRKSKSMRPR